MEFSRRKISNYIMVGTIILVIVWFNFSYFKNRISSNHQSISEYSLSDKDIIPPADLAMVAIFYPADIYQTDKNGDGYIEHTASKIKNFPRIMIEPHHGYRRSGQVAAESFDLLRPIADAYNNIILLGPSHKKFNGVALPKNNVIKTPVGEVIVNSKITAELQKNPLFKGNNNYYTPKNSLNVQLPFIQKTFKSVKVVPILYGQIDAQELAKIIDPYLNKKNTLLIVTADLPKYFSPVDNKISDDGLIVKQDYHRDCSKIGIDTVLLLAKKHGFVPHWLTASQNTSTENLLFTGKSWSYDEPADQPVLQGTELFYSNIRNFIRHHNQALTDIAQKSLAFAPRKRYRIKRKNYNNFLFNRGASVVQLFQNGKLIGSSGEPNAVRAIAADVANNIFNIISATEEFKIKDKKSLNILIYLLTEPEEIKFSSYDNLLEKVEYGVDGLMIPSGKRSGFLLPDTWVDVKDKNEFITKLKIKAGLSPTYWSDDVKIFRFRMAEVKNDKDW